MYELGFQLRKFHLSILKYEFLTTKLSEEKIYISDSDENEK